MNYNVDQKNVFYFALGDVWKKMYPTAVHKKLLTFDLLLCRQFIFKIEKKNCFVHTSMESITQNEFLIGSLLAEETIPKELFVHFLGMRPLKISLSAFILFLLYVLSVIYGYKRELFIFQYNFCAIRKLFCASQVHIILLVNSFGNINKNIIGIRKLSLI